MKQSYIYSPAHEAIMRDRKHYSDRAAAEVLGISSATVQKWRVNHGMRVYDYHQRLISKETNDMCLYLLHMGYSYGRVADSVPGVKSKKSVCYIANRGNIRRACTYKEPDGLPPIKDAMEAYRNAV